MSQRHNTLHLSTPLVVGSSARPVQPISQVLKPTTLSAVRTSLNARYGQLGTDLSLEELGLKS